MQMTEKSANAMALFSLHKYQTQQLEPELMNLSGTAQQQELLRRHVASEFPQNHSSADHKCSVALHCG
jgi:hypothetical protein